MSYKKWKLKELLTIKNGKDHKKLAEGAYPVYGSAGYMRSVNSFLYDKTSILLPRKGTLNNIQYVSENPFWTVDTIYYTVLNENLYDPYYLYLYLNTLDLSGYNSGASIPSMTSKTYYSLNVELPEKKIQTKIANVIRVYDNLIENNNKRIKLLEQMAENLYKEWFVRFRFPGYEDVEFEEKKPRGWQELRLHDFGINLESGSRPKGGIVIGSMEEGIPSLGAEAVNGLAEFDFNNIKLIPTDFYKKLKRGKNKGNHILIYKDGAYIGKVTLFKYDFPFKEYAINEHVFFINSIREEYQNYLFFTLKQSAYFAMMQNLNRNAAQPGLSQLDINRIKILEPNKDIVIRFNDFVEPLLKEVFQLAKKNQTLTKQRDMLLPRLMSGKLEV